MSKLKLTIVMLLWGSIGIFTRYINISPVLLAFLRALISLPVLMLIIYQKATYCKIVFNDCKMYILSGVLIGWAWATLFYGFKNTSIAHFN